MLDEQYPYKDKEEEEECIKHETPPWAKVQKLKRYARLPADHHTTIGLIKQSLMTRGPVLGSIDMSEGSHSLY